MSSSTYISGLIFCLSIFLAAISPVLADIDIVNDVQTYETLTSETVNMSGIAKLYITGSTTPLSGCTINLNSEDSYCFLMEIAPSAANSSYIDQFKVNGVNAELDTNVRIVQYGQGCIIIPQSSTYKPVQVFTGDTFTGDSQYLSQYTEYGTSQLGTFANNISSFILKRGYMVTFAQNEDGTGHSKNYVAADFDLEIGVLPEKLNNRINFVRIFPWRWVGKKGSCDASATDLQADWWYNWSISSTSSLDIEYVGILQQPYWPSLDQDWQYRGINHLSGFNEPGNPVEDAYKKLNNGSVSEAVNQWSKMLGTGLRVGAPAVTDGGRDWLYSFMAAAEAADVRVDYVPIHYYWCYWDNSDYYAAASQLYYFLKAVHDELGKPIWLTEFNNGANWSGCADPTTEQNESVIWAMINMMDDVSWIERYAVYSNVEWTRKTHYNDGSLTPMGIMYRNHEAPIGYQQFFTGTAKSSAAMFTFEDNFHDVSGNGNCSMVYGAPSLKPGINGNALCLDGENDYLRLPTDIGEDSSMTFAAWVYWNGGDDWQRIFDFGDDTTSYMSLTPSSPSGTLRYIITNSGSGSNDFVETTALPVGQWTHVALRLRGTTASLYVNGEFTAVNTSMSLDPTDITPSVNYIGKSQWSSDPLFNGMMDDIIITDYALSADEIRWLYNNHQPARYVACPLDIVDVDSGNSQNSHPAIESYDRYRNTRWCNDGALGNAWITFDLGSVKEVDRLKFDFYNGSDRTYPLTIDIDGTIVFSGNTIGTTGFWEADITDTSGRYVTVTMTGSNSDGSNYFSIYETQIWPPLNQNPSIDESFETVFELAEGQVYEDNLALYASDPENDTLTYTKSSGPDWLNVLPDGMLTGIPLDRNVGQNTFTVKVADDKGLYAIADMTINVTNTFSGVLGMDDLVGLASSWLNMNCDDCGGADLDGDNDVTVDDLSMMSSHWLMDESMQLHLKLDGSAADSSMYHRGTLLNGSTVSTGHIDGSLAFDGVDDYINIYNYKGITGSSSRTCCTWIKTTQTNGIVFSWGLNLAGEKWIIRVHTDGTARAEVQGGYIYGSTAVNDDTWHHIAIVLEDDGSTDISEALIYVDGVLDTIGSSGAISVDTSDLNDVEIGTFSYAGTSTFAGELDDVRIYDSALTQAQIQAIVNQ